MQLLNLNSVSSTLIKAVRVQALKEGPKGMMTVDEKCKKCIWVNKINENKYMCPFTNCFVKSGKKLQNIVERI